MTTLEQFFEKKIVKPENLGQWAERLRSSGKTIATLNGSFDLLHAGHLEIIFQASKQADVLIVLLNSDASIQQYKSISRPIIPLRERLKMMAALSFVDNVSWFDETDPIKVLEVIKPTVHINGAEYGKNCIEAETVKRYGGEIHIVSLVPGLSTSEIINKIKQS